MALSMLSLSSAIRASSVPLDVEHRLPYNSRRTRPKKPDALTAAPPTNLTTTLDKRSPKISVSDLLKRDISKSAQGVGADHFNFTGVGVEELGGSYLGYETWLPTPPKVEKPRSVLNPASLAYIGDCIYELYARRHFLFPPLNIEEYNDRVMAVVRCEAQDAILQKLRSDSFLSQEERDVLRWGKNINSSKTRTKKRAGVAVYNRASSLETLVLVRIKKRRCILSTCVKKPGIDRIKRTLALEYAVALMLVICTLQMFSGWRRSWKKSAFLQILLNPLKKRDKMGLLIVNLAQD
ncbi:mini-ribonuclease 3 [Striga asiatica]|uniref:Mini-ribonuclease 3 n=1 Tax=Striga asiatica TaxID=4170 RepID=A0A5A7QNK5_STRAF|nr:mini-ribonuclease 3 [Striga asiatica]